MANSRFDRFLQRIANRFDRFDLDLQNKLLDVFPRLRDFVFPDLPLESGVGLLTPGAIGTGQFSTDVDAIAEFASNSQVNIAEELDSLGGIEGSAAIFETGGSGFHALTLTIESEDPLGQDAIAFFNGEQLFELDASAIEGTFNAATGKYEATVTIGINSAGDELAGIVLDREDAAGDTTVTFNSIEALGEDAVLDPLLSVVEVEVAIDDADPFSGRGCSSPKASTMALVLLPMAPSVLARGPLAWASWMRISSGPLWAKVWKAAAHY